MKKYNVKITVVKTVSSDELFTNSLENEVASGQAKTCPKLREGQEFIVGPTGDIPEGFCHWAWADIHRDVNILRFGGQFPWMKENVRSAYISCTDGLRPVIFKLEAVD